MYEFLAPWGMLVPAISAITVYAFIAEQRRKDLLALIEVKV